MRKKAASSERKKGADRGSSEGFATIKRIAKTLNSV